MHISQAFAKDWYLVYCKPRQELSAKLNLERQGYEVYLPMIHVRKRSQGKVVQRMEAMFPRYLFIRLAMGVDNWAPVRSTIGVSHLVKFGLELVKAPDDLIAELMSRSDAEGVIEIRQEQFKAGDRCRVANGVMEGYEGIVLARTGKERVKLMLNSINSSLFSFEMPDEQLELIC